MSRLLCCDKFGEISSNSGRMFVENADYMLNRLFIEALCVPGSSARRRAGWGEQQIRTPWGT